MNPGDLYIDTFEVPSKARRYSPGWIEFEQTRRTINNTLTSDFLAQKRKFFIEWSTWLDGDFIEYIVGIYLAGNDVVFKVCESDGTEKSYTCRLTIPSTYVREYEEKGFAYSGFNITLEEV
jgi:hypothetical protein